MSSPFSTSRSDSESEKSLNTGQQNPSQLIPSSIKVSGQDLNCGQLTNETMRLEDRFSKDLQEEKEKRKSIRASFQAALKEIYFNKDFDQQIFQQSFVSQQQSQNSSHLQEKVNIKDILPEIGREKSTFTKENLFQKCSSNKKDEIKKEKQKEYFSKNRNLPENIQIKSRSLNQISSNFILGNPIILDELNYHHQATDNISNNLSQQISAELNLSEQYNSENQQKTDIKSIRFSDLQNNSLSQTSDVVSLHISDHFSSQKLIGNENSQISLPKGKEDLVNCVQQQTQIIKASLQDPISGFSNVDKEEDEYFSKNINFGTDQFQSQKKGSLTHKNKNISNGQLNEQNADNHNQFQFHGEEKESINKTSSPKSKYDISEKMKNKSFKKTQLILPQGDCNFQSILNGCAQNSIKRNSNLFSTNCIFSQLPQSTNSSIEEQKKQKPLQHYHMIGDSLLAMDSNINMSDKNNNPIEPKQSFSNKFVTQFKLQNNKRQHLLSQISENIEEDSQFSQILQQLQNQKVFLLQIEEYILKLFGFKKVDIMERVEILQIQQLKIEQETKGIQDSLNYLMKLNGNDRELPNINSDFQLLYINNLKERIHFLRQSYEFNHKMIEFLNEDLFESKRQAKQSSPFPKTLQKLENSFHSLEPIQSQNSTQCNTLQKEKSNSSNYSSQDLNLIIKKFFTSISDQIKAQSDCIQQISDRQAIFEDENNFATKQRNHRKSRSESHINPIGLSFYQGISQQNKQNFQELYIKTNDPEMPISQKKSRKNSHYFIRGFSPFFNSKRDILGSNKTTEYTIPESKAPKSAFNEYSDQRLQHNFKVLKSILEDIYKSPETSVDSQAVRAIKQIYNPQNKTISGVNYLNNNKKYAETRSSMYNYFSSFSINRFDEKYISRIGLRPNQIFQPNSSLQIQKGFQTKWDEKRRLFNSILCPKAVIFECPLLLVTCCYEIINSSEVEIKNGFPIKYLRVQIFYKNKSQYELKQFDPSFAFKERSNFILLLFLKQLILYSKKVEEGTFIFFEQSGPKNLQQNQQIEIVLGLRYWRELTQILYSSPSFEQDIYVTENYG